MGLSSGTKLGPYEIGAPLGAGGMGEVYRARDTRLDRSVAIKILPQHLADKADASERFEREARTISSLNHPNICQLHDVGTHDGVRYLVMELLEGETLAERLRRGPLPMEQVLRYGAEIATGLQAAHRCGVVHRDLKPGNIMLTKSGAKLMDFGLAKGMTSPNAVSSELTATLTSSHATPLTQQGTIVGTFQYMAPEQVEGKEADARSDIFSLGAVLYEMVSGKRAFEGKTLVSVAASILEKEPEPIRTLQPVTPASLERAIRKCLAKDPDERWQSAGDLASELKWIAEGSGSLPAVARPAPARGVRVSEWLAWMFLAMAVIAVVVLSLVLGFSGGNKPVVRTQIAAPEKLQFNFVGDNGGPPVISPDGKNIVFSGREDGKNHLFLRLLDKLTPQSIAGTDEGTFPFWSPDSRSIAFFADGKLKRIDLAGGAPLTICDAPAGRGGSWSKNGNIVFSPTFTDALLQVPATGGTPSQATKLSDKYTTHRWPWFLPDGRHFLYLAANHAATTSASTAVFWASLDGKENKFLFVSRSNAIFVSGYMLYVRDNTLMAQPFDGSQGEFKGDAVALNDDVQIDGTVWRGAFSASENGTLIYQPGMARAGARLTWFDRSGKELGSVAGPDAYSLVELSPDDKKAAVTLGGNPSGVIWIYDVVHNTRTRFTFGSDSSVGAIWSHDGKQIAYLAGDPTNVFSRKLIVKAADGSGQPKEIGNIGSAQSLQEELDDWSPDGHYLLYDAGTIGKDNGVDIWALPMFGDTKPFAFISAPGDQGFAQFSPDGKWVSYASTETGRMEVYVMPFPATGAKWQISTNGGTRPRWRRDGKEIMFEVPGSGKVMSAQVNTHGSNFEPGEIRVLFEGTNLPPNNAGSQWSLTSDAQRLLAITTGETGALPLTLIQNWTAELKRK
jgi:Tol biopolymer transport system component/tRNA A-37 threonylcarbamoyl transferase component Bud32